ncbi:18014_t:CDS:2, partial [Gigaspora margarita]
KITKKETSMAIRNNKITKKKTSKAIKRKKDGIPGLIDDVYSLKNDEQIQEEFKQKVNNYQYKNLNNLDVYLEIAKTYPKLEIEAKYQIALHYNNVKNYKEALNIRLLLISMKKLQMINDLVQCLSATGKFENDFEIWKQIRKREDKGLSKIAEKKINEYNSRRRKKRQIIKKLRKIDRC